MPSPRQSERKRGRFRVASACAEKDIRKSQGKLKGHPPRAARDTAASTIPGLCVRVNGGAAKRQQNFDAAEGKMIRKRSTR